MDRSTDWREAEVLRRARLGDENAVGEIVDAHAGPLIGYLARLTGDFHQAEDLAQETFLRAFDHLDRFTLGRPFRPWLFRIGRNLALNYLGSRVGRERRETKDVSVLRDLGVEGSPEGALEAEERRKGVERVLELLPVHFREVLHLRYMEGLGYEAIASQLDLPLGTVKTWIHRAKRAFVAHAEAGGIEF